METVNGVTDGDKGGPPPPSPLTGCYLLIVVGEPHSEQHKDIILQRIAKGLLSWDLNDCLVDLEKELAIITEQALEGEEARYGERLIQFASENLVTEILIHPVVSTLAQCMRNLLSSFTRHRHIIHAGYTFAANGSWALQDGTFSMADFSEAFQELEVQRVIRAYENSISLDLHCSPEGDWSRLPKEHFAKACKVRVNPTDVLTTGCPSITEFINYISPFLLPSSLENLLESSDVVGNIRFSRPTLYVFPGGQGDAALFGINGFNMLLDGGFSRKACFWDFVRHLDRLDAVLMTRLNNSNVGGISSVLRRKKQDAVYPQIGHFFCNIQERKAILSPDGDKDRDPLLISLLEEGQEIISNLRHLNLNPQVCYRDSEPINLYHKVGHGTLDMYVLSPAKDSKEVREFLQKWNQSDQKLFANSKSSREFSFPIQNLISIAALLVWQPANPNDTITRILFPGSSPQRKIFEGLDRLKNLEFIKHPVCTEKSLVPSSTLKKATKDSIIEKVISKEKISLEKKENKIIENNLSINGEIKEKTVKKSDSTESERSTRTKKIEDKIIENGEKPKAKPKPSKIRGEPQQKRKTTEKKSSPTTPKKTVENGETKKPTKPSPIGTPAKSTKDANNRKVIESKTRSAKPPPAEPKPKVERKPISRRPKGSMKAPISPVKKLVNGVQKPDSISKKGKLDKEGTTDSSTVSTPSADQESLLKKDISKLTPEEMQQMKAQELADLKEEQEAVKEIEAVFRKGEVHPVKDENLRKVKEVSIDEDKLEKEEYLIIEKEEIDHDSLDEKEPKEDETQKLARDSEESEKQRKLSAEEQVIEKHEKIEDQVNNIVTEAADIVKAKEEIIEAGKEPVITSSEEKPDVSSTDKKITDKEIEEEIKYVVDSQPDEKVSGNIKSGDTTTAPTLPEDERIPLDEIKEDSGQIIEEKHVKEETKEKEVPLIQLPPKTFETVSKVPGVVGIRLDKQSHIRDIVKTPDEVADLPVHEEVDYEYTHELKTETKTNEIIEEKKDIKVDEKVQDFIKDSEETMGYLKEQAKGIEQEKDKDEVVQEQLKEIIEDVNKTSIMQEELKHLTDTVLQSEVALEKSILNDTEKSVAKEKLKSPIEIQQDKLDEQFKHLPDDELHQKDLIDEIQKSDTDLSKKMIEIEEKQDIKREQLPTEDTLEKAELETKEKFDLREETKEKTEAKERGGKEEPEQDIIGEKVTETEEAVDMKEVVKAEKKDIKDETESTELFKEVKPKESKEIIEEVIKEKGITNVESIDKGKPAEEIIEKKEEVTVSKEKAENEEKGEKVETDVKEPIENENYVMEKSGVKETVEKDELKEDKTDVEEINKKRETKEQEEDKIDTKEKPLVNGEVLEAEKVKEKIDIESHKNLKKSDDAADNGTKSEKEDKVDKVDSEKKVEETQDTGKQVKSIERTGLDPEKKDAEKKVVEMPSIEEVKTELVKQSEEIIKATKEDKFHLEKIEEKLQHLKEISPEPRIETIEPKKLEEVSKTEKTELIKATLEDKAHLKKLEDKLLELKEAADVKFEKTQDSETIVEEDDEKEQIETGDLVEKVELGRKSPKEREEDVIKIVASVAEVLKSDAPLEEFEGKLPISTFSPYTTTYTTELRETHITTVDSPTVENKVIKTDDIPTIPEEPSSASFLEEERKIAPVHESESDKEDKRSSLLKESQELMMATSKIISEIKSGKSEEKDDSDEAGIVHRMLVTASSEDGGEEIEICPVGTITFSKSSESSGRSSPEKSQELSKKSSIVDTISDSLSTVKQVVELHSEKDSGIDDVKSDTDLESQEKETDAVSTTAIEAGKISPFEKSEEIVSQTVSGKSSPDKDASIKSLASGKSTPDISDFEKSKEITSSFEDLKKSDDLSKKGSEIDLPIEMEISAKETSKAEVKEEEAKEIVVTQKEVSKIESAISKETDQLEKRGTLPEGTSKFDESFSEIPQKEEKAVKDERRNSLLEKIEDTVKDQLEAVTDFTKSLFSKDEKDIKIVSDLEQGFGKGKEEVEEIKKQEKTVEDSKITEEDIFEKIEDKIKETIETVSSFLEKGGEKLEDTSSDVVHTAEDVKEAKESMVSKAEEVIQETVDKLEEYLEDTIKAVSHAMDTHKSVIAQDQQDTVSSLPAADGEIKEIKASVADKPKDVIEILTDEIDNITDKVTAADKLVEVSKASTDNVLDSKTKVTEEVKKDIVDSSNASSAEEKGVKSVTLEDTPRVKTDSAAEKLVDALERTALTPLKDVINADKVSDNVGENEISDFETVITISKKSTLTGATQSPDDKISESTQKDPQITKEDIKIQTDSKLDEVADKMTELTEKSGKIELNVETSKAATEHVTGDTTEKSEKSTVPSKETVEIILKEKIDDTFKAAVDSSADNVSKKDIPVSLSTTGIIKTTKEEPQAEVDNVLTSPKVTKGEHRSSIIVEEGMTKTANEGIKVDKDSIEKQVDTSETTAHSVEKMSSIIEKEITKLSTFTADIKDNVLEKVDETVKDATDDSFDQAPGSLEKEIQDQEIKIVKDTLLDKVEETAKSTVDPSDKTTHAGEKKIIEYVTDDTKIGTDTILSNVDKTVKATADNLDKAPETLEKEIKESFTNIGEDIKVDKDSVNEIAKVTSHDLGKALDSSDKEITKIVTQAKEDAITAKDSVLDKLEETSKAVVESVLDSELKEDIDKEITDITDDIKSATESVKVDEGDITKKKDDLETEKDDKLDSSEEASNIIEKTKKRKESIVEQLEGGVRSTFSAIADFGKSFFDKGEKAIEDTASKAEHVVEGIVEKLEEDIKFSLATVQDFEKSLLHSVDNTPKGGIDSADIENNATDIDLKTDSSEVHKIDGVEDKTDESSIKSLDDQKVEKDSVVLITEDLKSSEFSEKAIQDTTLEKSTPDGKQEDKNIDAKDSISTDVKDDKSSLADVKLTDLPEKALTTTKEFKEYTDTKLPTDLSGKSDADLKSATKDSGPDIVLDTRTDKKISESVIKPLDSKAELADHQTNDKTADKELLEDDTKSSVVSRKSSHDLISDIKTDIKEKEFKKEKEPIESLQKEKLSDEKTDTKDSKAVQKIDIEDDLKDSILSHSTDKVAEKGAETKQDESRKDNLDLTHDKDVADDKTELERKSSPDLKIEGKVSRKHSISEIKDNILKKITPEVKDTDEPADKKDDILSEVLPIKSAVEGKDSKLTTEEVAAVTKSEVLDIKETKHVGDLSEPEQQLGKDHVAQSKDESSKSTSDTKLEDTIHEKQEKVPADLSKKSIEEIKFEIKETMVSDPSDIKKEKSDVSDEKKHTKKSEDIKDDILRKSANIITDATFTTTDVKSSLSKTDDQDLAPVSDKLTRAVADEKILEKEEQILEKPADDLRQTFETVSDLTESIIFDKCDKPSSKVEVVDEKLPKDEEKCLEGITEACETVAEITKSVIFDKSEKHPTEIETMDEKKLKEKDSDKSTENLKSLTFDKCGISTELDEIDPNILEEEKTARKKSADDLKETYTVSKLSKPLSFEECESTEDKILQKEEKALEDRAEELKETYETVSTLSKSLSFEKCDKPEDRILQKEEKALEDHAEELQETYETVSTLSKSLSFEKCEKPEEKILEKEEKALEDRAEELNETYEAVSTLSKSLSFEKCEKPADKILEKEEKALEDRAEELKETYETVSTLSKSLTFEKCEKPEEKILEKEEKALEDRAEELQETYETVSTLSKSLSFEKCEKPEDKIFEKEEKALEDRVEELKETFDTLTDMSQSVVFEKCEPVQERRKSLVEELLEKSTEDLTHAFEIVSDMSKSVIFEKCDKEEHKEKSDSEKELYDEKSGIDLTAKDSAVKDIIKKVTSDIDTKSTEAEIKSPKDLPDSGASELKAKSSDIKDIIDAVTVDLNTKSIEAELKKSPELLVKDNKLQKSSESLLTDATADVTNVFEKCEKETMEKVTSGSKASKSDLREDVGVVPQSIILEDKELKDLDSKETLPSLEKEMIKDDIKKLDSKEEILKLEKSTLDITEPESKKLSISDVEISLADAKVSEDEICPKDTSTSTKLTEAERRLSTDKKSEKGDIKDDKQKTESKDTGDSCDNAKESLATEKIEVSIAGPSSTLEKPKDLSESSDVTEIEKQKELQDTLLHEKHIPGAVTPPTVPVSPNIIESYSDDIRLSSRTEALIKEMGLRSSTPGSDDFEIVTSTQSDISSGQVSKMPLDSEKLDSDEDDQLSVTSQVAHSRESSHYDLDEDSKIGIKIDPMSMSFYGALPDDDSVELGEKQAEPSYLYEITKAKFSSGVSVDESDAKLDQINKNKQLEADSLMSASCIGELPSSSHVDDKKDPIESWGKPLGLPAPPTFLYEITKAKYTAQGLCKSTEGALFSFQDDGAEKLTYLYEMTEAKCNTRLDEDVDDLDHINQNEQGHNMMTASFYGNLPSSFGNDKDPISSWGKPLGLPSPAPPNDNKGTPKKERKLPPNVTAKNKLNDDKKRAESPSKYKNKKVNPVYVDLTYVPHHGNSYYSYVDFFKRVRARYYVFSGIEPSRDVYNALLEAKQTWEDKELEVTIIPTYDTDILGYWVAENEELLTKYKIDLSPSASRCTINLQDHETSCSAYRLEF